MKSKTLATWIAVLGGSLGLHRFYLHGLRDPWGWMHPLPTLLGLYGVRRVLELGQDDHVAWVLVPLLGASLATGMLMAIIYGLTSDEVWDQRFNPRGPASHTGWGPIFGVVLALVIGAGVLMATIAFSAQRFFEYQIEEAHKISR